MQNFDKSVAEIERIIGYTFTDKSLLKQAFTRTSYCNEHKAVDGVRLQSNEVLEFFGDDPSSKATLWVKAQHEGALPPPCIVRKDPRVPHTARRGPETP